MTNHHLTFFHLASCMCEPNRRAGQHGAACTYACTHTCGRVHARDVAADTSNVARYHYHRDHHYRGRRRSKARSDTRLQAASCLACIGSQPSTGLLGKIRVTSNFKSRLIYSAYVPCTSMYPADVNVARSDAIYGTDL